MKNPKRYRAMSEPFESREAANVAVEAFYKDLEEIREKHKMREVAVVVASSYVEGDEEGEFILPLSFGDTEKHIGLYAYGLAFCEAERERNMERIRSAGKKRGGAA